MANFNISLADVCIHVSSLFPFVRVYCQDYLTEDAPDFSVSIKQADIDFEREKAKEMLAYLIDRAGSSVTTEQLAVALWEDRIYDRTLKNYISTILGSLKKTLRQVGKEDILIKTHNHLSVNPEKIKCDAYDYEKGIASAINSFRGEYMVNYSWAEFKTGTYVAMDQDRL